MCQPNQKCPLCLQAEKKSRERAGMFSCQKCQTNFQNGIKLVKKS